MLHGHQKEKDDAGLRMTVFIVIVSYFIVSMSMVFFNKTLLTEGTSIPAPLFVTWYQCLITAVIISCLGEFGRRASKSQENRSQFSAMFTQFPPFEFDIEISLKVMPLSIVLVLMIALNNLCLQYVEVTFYQVARGLTTVFNVVLSYFYLGEATSFRAMFCCGIILVGFYMGVENEVRFTFVGTMFGVSSSLFVCLNALFTKRYIQYINDGNQYKLLLYNNINATILFIPVIIFSGEHLILLEHGEYLTSPKYWTLMTMTGLFGFLVGIITVFQITLTSPLTHNIAGTAKATLQTVVALLVYQNPVTWKGLVGIALVLIGSTLYTAVRHAEMNQRTRTN